MATADARNRFLALARTAITDGTLVKLTLGKHCGADATLRNVFARPVSLKAGPHITFVYRHSNRDITKNLPPAEALALIERLLGADFQDAHLFTPAQAAQLEMDNQGKARLSVKTLTSAPPPAIPGHNREKMHPVPADAPWLKALGITTSSSQPREGMAAKYRQINKFVELLEHSFAGLGNPGDAALKVVDMGCGKGYLTFATATRFGNKVQVLGIEARPELVGFCNRVAQEQGLNNLSFSAGTIENSQVPQADVLVALHACDTATDDAIAKGIAAGARLIVVSPCCQKELRPQLKSPPVLADALRHGIFQERQAEFVTDAMRAQLLECAGYRTKVFEFVSTEHTAKNLMITATKNQEPSDGDALRRLRDFARFYGIRSQRLAAHLGIEL